jgi:hypothetical protein
MRALSLALLIMMLFVAAASAAAQTGESCRAYAVGGSVNVRWGPGQNYGALGAMLDGTARDVTGVSEDGDWYAVAWDEDDPYHEFGWIAAWVVVTGGDCDALPTVPPPPEPPAVAYLMDVPVLPAVTEAAREIFAQGQALGNDARAFTKVGDCNTDTVFFLAAFDTGNYALGPYADLQPTVDYFAGWWSHESVAGQVGYGMDILLDPLWANPDLCQPGETLLACEYRRTRPAAAVMMFGPNDMIAMDEAQFEEALRGVVELSIERGVIPVLTTFTWHMDRKWLQALAFNRITAEVADEYGVPLINLWRAARDLPGYGLMSEYTHLTDGGMQGGRIQFTNGEEARYGHALRNLLTLQTLDMLRREVMQGQ